VTLVEVAAFATGHTVFPGGATAVTAWHYVVNAEIARPKLFTTVLALIEVAQIEQVPTESHTTFAELKMLGGHRHTGQLDHGAGTLDPAILIEIDHTDLVETQQSHGVLPADYTERQEVGRFVRWTEN
jgi:hypothetical protein